MISIIDISFFDIPSSNGLFRDEQEDISGHRWMDRTVWNWSYHKGYREGHYPVPAIPLQVVWPDEMNYVGYKDMIYIDSLQHGEDDPVMVCAWDFFTGPNRIGKYGEYTPTT